LKKIPPKVEKSTELDYSYCSDSVTELQLQNTYTGLSLRFQVAGYNYGISRQEIEQLGIKTESIWKLSNLNFLWTKTLC